MNAPPQRHVSAPLATLAALIADLPINNQANVDWSLLVPLAEQHGVGPLLLHRLSRQPVDGIPPELLASLQAERNRVAVQHLLALRMQEQVARIMSQAEIPCVWLKGIVLAHTVYPSPELRPMVDVDALVPFEARKRALANVEEAGFSLDSPQLFDGRDGLKHHYFLQNRTYHPLSFELHYRLLGPLDRLLSVHDQKWFWQHTRVLQHHDSWTATALKPEAHLLYLCAHAILQHGEAGLRLIHVYDLDRVLAETADIDWDLLFDGASRLRWSLAVERALTLTHEYFGTPLPSFLLSELSRIRPSPETRERVERRQSARTTTDTVMDDLSAMSWRNRLRVVGRILTPPPKYMRWRYGLEGNRGLPGAYARRMRRIASDAVHSLRHRIRESE